MIDRRRCIHGKRLSFAAAAAAVSTILFVSFAGRCDQIDYTTLLSVSGTVVSTGASLSVAPSASANGTASRNAVTINSNGGTPYVLFFDEGLNATGLQRNLRSNSGIAAYQLCQDPACEKVWTTNGSPDTGVLVVPGHSASALPLNVVRAANAADDGSYSDTLTLTVYF